MNRSSAVLLELDQDLLTRDLLLHPKIIAVSNATSDPAKRINQSCLSEMHKKGVHSGVQLTPARRG